MPEADKLCGEERRGNSGTAPWQRITITKGANDNVFDRNRFEEKTWKTETVFQGRIISLQVEHVTLPDGTRSTREVVKHPGAVAVLAVHEGKMLVVEQYRKALQRALVEIPAGKLEPGEDPLAAAARELQEETGFSARELVPICSFYTSPGFADELIHLYYADQLEKGDASPDADEFLSVQALTLDEAKRAIADGAIRDAKTTFAVYAWQLYQMTGSFA
jgi:ADP-ribose pyrophosphatase